MSGLTARPHPNGPTDRLICARQADTGLDRLLSGLLNARREMQGELRRRPPDGKRQTAARRRLLESLEAYTAAIVRRGLPAPPALRDELALQRNLAGQIR
jgi:hypothetical protein